MIHHGIDVNKVDSYSTRSKEKHEAVTISYSQLSLWSKCPHAWKLKYIDKHKEYVPTIHTVFGTAFHETLQHYLKMLYDNAYYMADLISFEETLKTQLIDIYKSECEKYGTHFSSKDELLEFYKQGVEILTHIRKNRDKYFHSKKYRLHGIEIPIYSQVSDENKNVYISGYIDLVLYDTQNDRYLVIDIKTSSSGWYKSKMEDTTTTSQVLLYKHFLSKEHNIPLDKIDVKYFIVKRDPLGNEWTKGPIGYVQQFNPETDLLTVDVAMKKATDFVDSCFNEDGEYRLDVEYPALKGLKGSNCKFCDFKNREDLCPSKNRK